MIEKVNGLFVSDSFFDSPFYVFIKAPNVSFTEILNELNYETVELKGTTEELLPKLFYMYQLGDWILIMDGWHYGLYHDEKFQINVNELGNRFDIVTGLIGDSDNSYEYQIYSKGELIRHYYYYETHNSSEVKKDLGAIRNSEDAFKIKMTLENRMIDFLKSEIDSPFNVDLELVRFFKCRTDS